MSPKTLLYAEDEPDDVLLLQCALKKAELPIQLVTASDGQEVIDYLSRSDKFTDPTRYPWPSLLLLDIHLPKKSGLEVLQWIRQHPALDTLVVLMFTSSELDLDVHSSINSGSISISFRPTSCAPPTCQVPF